MANAVTHKLKGLSWLRPLVAVILGPLLILTACVEEGGLIRPDGNTPEGGAARSPTPTEFPPTHVGLVAYRIEMIATLPSGPNTFEVTNEGTMPHNFAIEGPGFGPDDPGRVHMFDTNLEPGETRTMAVDLQPGPYVVYCPVDNHRELGMGLQVTVTPR